MALDTRTIELAKTVFEAAQEIKGKDIVGLNLSDVESYTDFIFIISAGSDRQVKALSDNVIKKVFEKHHLHPLGTEGYEQGEWVLIDFGEVIAHVFFEEAREFYHLEDIWLQVEAIPEEKIESYLDQKAKPSQKKQTAIPR